MRRLTTALLAGCLLGASAVPAIAQEPPPPPWFGGRVEMLSEGIAVTISDDWVAIDLTADVEAQLAEIEFPAATPGDSNAELLLWSPAGDACGMDIVRIEGPVGGRAVFRDVPLTSGDPFDGKRRLNRLVVEWDCLGRPSRPARFYSQ